MTQKSDGTRLALCSCIAALASSQSLDLAGVGQDLAAGVWTTKSGGTR